MAKLCANYSELKRDVWDSSCYQLPLNLTVEHHHNTSFSQAHYTCLSKMR